MKYTKRALRIEPSLTLQVTARGNEMKKQGIDVVSFGAGEPDFATPQYIVEAGCKAFRSGVTKYTVSSGTIELRQAIADKLSRDNNLQYSPRQIIVTNGAKQAIQHVIQLLVEEGDEVIIFSPYWLSYPQLAQLSDGKCVFVKGDDNNRLKVSAAQLQAAITDRTRLVIFNSPNNPTGVVYTKEEVQAFAKVICQYKDICVISDEIYEKLIFNGEPHYSIACASEDMFKRTFVINGMSKAYSMTGLRVGYVACPDIKSATYLSDIHAHETGNINSVAQYASYIALTDEQDMGQMVATFDKRRQLMNSLLAKIDGLKIIVGDGAFYTMVNVSGLFGKSYKGQVIDGAAKFAQLLLDDFFVVTIPCESFGDKRFVRLSYTVDLAEINKGIERIRTFVGKIN